MDLGELRSTIESMGTLDEVMKFAMSQTPRWFPEDVVIQDEYSHDVIFRVSDETFFVLDST